MATNATTINAAKAAQAAAAEQPSQAAAQPAAPDDDELDSRHTRAADTRAADERPRQWAPPELLPDPVPQEGYVFRWVRINLLGAADPVNLSSKLREGWEPVKAAEQPQLSMLSTAAGRFKDCIEIGGLILCKMPDTMARQRDAYYVGQANQQMESIDSNFMRENDARMPLFKQRKTTVTFGRGS